MDEFERFAAALAAVESSNTEIAWGDPKAREGQSYDRSYNPPTMRPGANFMACGRWQMHPAFVWDYRPEPIHVDSSWDEVFRQVLHNFYQRRRFAAPLIDRLAMEFHLGVTAVAHGDWDDHYAHRFAQEWAKLGGE